MLFTTKDKSANAPETGAGAFSEQTRRIRAFGLLGVIDLGVHRLDLALWLMGYPRPVWVMGRTYDPIASALAAEQGVDYDVEDLTVTMITFENGATLELEASWAAHVQEKEWHVAHRYGGGRLAGNGELGRHLSERRGGAAGTHPSSIAPPHLCPTSLLVGHRWGGITQRSNCY
jgi:predicted dehydrogenase